MGHLLDHRDGETHLHIPIFDILFMEKEEEGRLETWRDVLNGLLCSKRIDGYALLDTSTANVVLGFGNLYEGFMIPDSEGSVSGVEERGALVQSVQSVEVPTSIRLKGRGFIVVRRETSFIFGVGHRKRQSVSLHSLYGGVLVVTYSRVSSPSCIPLQAVLGALMT